MVVVVTLRDGSTVAENVLALTRMRLEDLSKNNYIVFFDLVQKCKDSRYQLGITPLGDSREILINLRFIDEQEEVHDDIRKIVLNSVEQSKLSITLVNPLSSKEFTQIHST